MPLTAEDAARQVAAELQRQEKFNLGNVLDAVIGVVVSNKEDLQAMLNELLKKKGVLTASEEQQLKTLLEKQEEERKKRQRIRTKNILLATLIAAAAGFFIYKTVKK